MTAPRRHRARKRFGQHFLVDPWARKVVAALAPAPGDVFLEIGPGRGALTLPLADTGAPVLAVDIDRDLTAELAARVPPNVTLLTGDVLTLDVLPFLAGLQPQRPPSSTAGDPAPARRFRAVGNLPYNLSTPILFRLIDMHRRHGVFADATLMLQREVADRLVAEPGSANYGALTLQVRLLADVERLLSLPPGAFRPPPKVHSAVVRLRFRPPEVDPGDRDTFARIARGLFFHRRKTLANALDPVAHAFGQSAQTVLRRAGLEGGRRPQTLSVADVAGLARAVL